jgi:hypothetical protein
MSKYSGRSQASNLSGLLSNISGTIGEMGEPGKQYVDTFRRSMAPDAGMNDSASMLRYSDWARRNGYDEEAKQYMVLGTNQQKIEQEKAYSTAVATGTEKIRGLRSKVGVLDEQIKQQEALGVPNPSLLIARDELDAQLSKTIESMNAAGNASNYGDGTEGAKAVRSVEAEELASQRAGIELQKLIADTNEAKVETDILVSEGDKIPRTSLQHIDYKTYENEMAQSQSIGDRVRINRSWRARNESQASINKEQNQIVAQGQIDVIFKDLEAEGSNLINDDDLTDFLQELPDGARENMNAVIVANAMQDSEWINADADKQNKIIKKIFVDQYSQLYRKDFGAALANREAGKELETQDAIADYEPGTNPDIPASQGGGKESFDQWYQNAKTIDPTYTKEEARRDWDKEKKRGQKEEVVRPVPGYSHTNRAGRPVSQGARQEYPSTTGNFSNKAGR